MAIAHHPPGIPRISGKFGDKIYKWYGKKCVVQSLPTYTKKRRVTGGLKRAWGRFTAASEFAKRVQADPVAHEYYRPHARRAHLTVRSLAMSDYLNEPKIEFRRMPRAHAGSELQIDAGDRYKVTTLEITVRDTAGRVVESGPAKRHLQRFIYLLQKDHRPNTTLNFEAVARDRPGHCVTIKTSVVVI